jgi:hypothetical protein
MHVRDLQDQTGSQDVSRGRQAGGQATAREIILLERASKVRTSMAAGLQDDWIVEIVRRTAWLDQRKMDPGTMVRILGEAGKRLMAAVPPESSKFDVSLQVTTALPYDQERNRLQMAEVFKALGPDGYAVLPELLAAFEVENSTEVLGRIRAWGLFRQFVQAQQAAAGAAALPGPGAGQDEAPVEEVIAAGEETAGEEEAPLEEVVAAGQQST